MLILIQSDISFYSFILLFSAELGILPFCAPPATKPRKGVTVQLVINIQYSASQLRGSGSFMK